MMGCVHRDWFGLKYVLVDASEHVNVNKNSNQRRDVMEDNVNKWIHSLMYTRDRNSLWRA